VADVRIACRTAMVRLDGSLIKVRRGRTLAHADHPIVRENPDDGMVGVEVPADGTLSPPIEGDGSGTALPALVERPGDRDARPVWDTYAAALGLNAEVVAGLSNKGEVIALADAVAAGDLVLADDGTLVDPTAPEG
jgi:hypothetical protein